MHLALGKFVLQKKSKLFTFLKLSKQIEKQALSSKGIVEVKLIGTSLNKFYTATLWETEEDMRAFAHSGHHLEAIKISKSLAKEMSFVFYEHHEIPSKKEIVKVLQEHPAIRNY